MTTDVWAIIVIACFAGNIACFAGILILRRTDMPDEIKLPQKITEAIDAFVEPCYWERELGGGTPEFAAARSALERTIVEEIAGWKKGVEDANRIAQRFEEEARRARQGTPAEPEITPGNHGSEGGKQGPETLSLKE